MNISDCLENEIIEFVKNFRSTLENSFNDILPLDNKHLIVIPSIEMINLLPDQYSKFDKFMFEGIYKTYSIYSCSTEEDAVLFLLSVNGSYIKYD